LIIVWAIEDEELEEVSPQKKPKFYIPKTGAIEFIRRIGELFGSGS